MCSLSNKIVSFVLVLILAFEFSLVYFLTKPTKAHAASVELSATVLPLPPSATINDFDFSQINPAGEGKVYL